VETDEEGRQKVAILTFDEGRNRPFYGKSWVLIIKKLA